VSRYIYIVYTYDYETKIILWSFMWGNRTKKNRGRIYNNYKHTNINNNTLHGRKIKMFFARKPNVIFTPPLHGFRFADTIHFKRWAAKKKNNNFPIIQLVVGVYFFLTWFVIVLRVIYIYKKVILCYSLSSCHRGW